MYKIKTSLFVKQNSVECAFANSESWTILSPIEQRIKQKIEAIGTPLKDWDISINYGIKTGCNEAFIIDEAKKNELIAADPKSAEIIRPFFLFVKGGKHKFSEKYPQCNNYPSSCTFIFKSKRAELNYHFLRIRAYRRWKF